MRQPSNSVWRSRRTVSFSFRHDDGRRTVYVSVRVPYTHGRRLVCYVLRLLRPRSRLLCRNRNRSIIRCVIRFSFFRYLERTSRCRYAPITRVARLSLLTIFTFYVHGVVSCVGIVIGRLFVALFDFPFSNRRYSPFSAHDCRWRTWRTEPQTLRDSFAVLHLHSHFAIKDATGHHRYYAIHSICIFY